MSRLVILSGPKRHATFRVQRTIHRIGQKAAWFKKGSGTAAGTAGHRPKVGRVLRTTVPDPFLNPIIEDQPSEPEVDRDVDDYRDYPAR